MAEGESGTIGHLHHGHPLGQRQSCLHRVGEAPPDPLLGHEAVDDHFDRVGEVPIELQVLGEIVDLPIDPGSAESLPGQFGEQSLVLTLATSHDGRQDLETGALLQFQNLVDDLLGGLPGDRRSAQWTVRHPDTCEQQAKVVVDLCDGAHGRARVAAGGLLIDRDGRRQALDEVDIGLVHLSEELAGVGRERFDVAALSLGIDRVECQRRLARPREAGEDDQLLAGQLHVDVAEVVLSGTFDEDRIGHLAGE